MWSIYFVLEYLKNKMLVIIIIMHWFEKGRTIESLI